MSDQINARAPGLVALEQHRELGGDFSVIAIPKFARRLAFVPQPACDGRSVEWVPYDVADYMMKRFNKTGRAHLTIAYDLMNGSQSGVAAEPLSLDQFRAMLRRVAQEEWFQQLLRTGGSLLVAEVAETPVVVAGGEAEEVAVEEEELNPSAPYKPRHKRGGRG